MDVTGLAKLATSMAETGTKQEVDIAILKKAQQIESSHSPATIVVGNCHGRVGDTQLTRVRFKPVKRNQR